MNYNYNFNHKQIIFLSARQDSVPNVSGLPLGGLASAGRNSRRNETPTALVFIKLSEK